MKQTLITRLVLGAIAGMAAMSANAGQITASSTNVAREVITTDTQAINAPSISYRFAGDINATVQAQEFQIQFTLEDGANWAGLPSDNAITITPTAGTDAGVVGVGGGHRLDAYGRSGTHVDGTDAYRRCFAPPIVE